MKIKKKKSKILALILSIIMMLSLTPTGVFAEEGVVAKSAPQGKPIYNQEDLANISDSDSAQYYLANDIVVTGEWTTLKTFRGILDGNGHKITGLNITKGTDDGYGGYKFGLFEMVGASGIVKNLGIEGTINITDEALGEDAEAISAGLLAATISNDYYNPEKEARINNIWVKGEVIVQSEVEYKTIGALTGSYNTGIGNNVYSAVKGADIVGKLGFTTKLSNFYYDNNLYTDETIDANKITGKTTEFMQSQEFVDLLNLNRLDGIEWVKNSEGYPYQEFKVKEEIKNIAIYTIEDLAAINEDLAANYTLMNDIDLSGQQWTMIGTKATPFKGTLNGNGYEIRNFNYSGKDASIGLIAASEGTIKNLGIVGGKVETTSVMTDSIGAIVGLNKGTIENCYVTGVSITPKYALRSGLVAGDNLTGKIKNTYSSGVGSKGAIAVGNGIYENTYYDSEVITPTSQKDSNIGKTTLEMQSQEFVDLLNSNTIDDIKWVKVEGDYPKQVNKEDSIEPPVIDEEKIAETLNEANEIRNNIVDELKDTKDPWTIMSIVANGNKEDLVNVSGFIKESYETITTTNSIYDIERTIIGLSALGVDIRSLSNGSETINALEILANKDITSLVNATIFALVAYDSGAYDLPENSKYTREDIISLIIEKQSTKGGWSLIGRGEDVDMTAMALHSLAPYYTAASFEEAGISEEIYNSVKEAVNKGINLLSDLQLEDGSFSTDKYVTDSNTNSTAMVINTLSALGIDALRDGKFIKNQNNIMDGLLKFQTQDGKGFGYKDTNYNAMATEQGFRGLVSYSKFSESKTAYNIYQVGKDTIGEEENPIPEEKPEDETKPGTKPEEKPETDPETKPEAKPETDPEIKPETKPEIKPEPKPETKPEAVPENNGKLPQTGGQSAIPMAMAGITMLLAGYGVSLKRKY